MDNLLIIIGFILSIVGVVGCIVPGIPGPPLNFAAIILLKIAFPDQVSWIVLILFGIITLAVTILDYAIPMIGGKLFKASRSGIIGSTIGMLIGIFIFPPFGIFIGLVVGAIVGEIISGKTKIQATKTGAGIFVLSIFAMIIKLVVSLIMSLYFLLKMSTALNYQLKIF
ncbi:MAG: DUF456 domain-containing protein [Ignavibacteriales bacterium]|nr:DUF456 domain-containing protein [Ignavibacteriales bacterium]